MSVNDPAFTVWLKKKKRELSCVNWKVSTILWYKGDYSAFGEAMYLRMLKDKNIFILIHFLLVR